VAEIDVARATTTRAREAYLGGGHDPPATIAKLMTGRPQPQGRRHTCIQFHGGSATGGDVDRPVLPGLPPALDRRRADEVMLRVLAQLEGIGRS
jgi:hypothetical protein